MLQTSSLRPLQFSSCRLKKPAKPPGSCVLCLQSIKKVTTDRRAVRRWGRRKRQTVFTDSRFLLDCSVLSQRIRSSTSVKQRGDQSSDAARRGPARRGSAMDGRAPVERGRCGGGRADGVLLLASRVGVVRARRPSCSLATDAQLICITIRGLAGIPRVRRHGDVWFG